MLKLNETNVTIKHDNWREADQLAFFKTTEDWTRVYRGETIPTKRSELNPQTWEFFSPVP